MKLDPSATIAKLLEELQMLGKQRDYIEGQMSNHHLALRSLVLEIEDKAERERLTREIEAARRKPAGLTQMISHTLRQTLESLTANDVRYWLQREGVDLSEYSQPLATISVTLRRLVERGLVKATRKGRKVTYKWVSS